LQPPEPPPATICHQPLPDSPRPIPGDYVNSPANTAYAHVLIDGYARVRALGELKRDTVAATVLALTEADALVLAFRLDSSATVPVRRSKRGGC